MELFKPVKSQEEKLSLQQIIMIQENEPNQRNCIYKVVKSNKSDEEN